ncbi:FAD-dependent oxidoreductase [Fodinibius sediminis]|uniref:D-amino-acid oxidase n=1 Tax=Fodinibius sediminis TaxID=1214077 RepID=A0A521D9L4_9BACT|nr:FAD-dependent oxidoreductase [Fodinibius sediminis]SMO68292.1 Glycine/D-amino acid oxidase [Fodinibius sediminis]
MDSTTHSKPVIIIGSGVSGLTTAYVLQLLGYDTIIYTDKMVEKIDRKNAHPDFASLFPSASVIPHSIHSDRLRSLFNTSQSLFYTLLNASFPGIERRRHHELFEIPKKPPKYLAWMDNVCLLDSGSQTAIAPGRPGIQVTAGWSFDCLFADWPVYFPALKERYLKQGGTIHSRKLHPEDISRLPAAHIVNCSGLGSRLLFDDPAPHLLLRGHLLYREGAPLLRTSKGGPVQSYNYTPTPGVYAQADGSACDVYCYPRRDGWILGGSRQQGVLTTGGQWRGKLMASPEYQIGNYKVPAPVVNLNREIIENSFSLPFGKVKELIPFIGYRYIRKKKGGLRLDHETIGDKMIYHNYGHGGAGVTLSWGCAIKVARDVTSWSQSTISEILKTRINGQ